MPFYISTSRMTRTGSVLPSKCS